MRSSPADCPLLIAPRMPKASHVLTARREIATGLSALLSYRARSKHEATIPSKFACSGARA
jgi:hypothetical protein